MRVVKRIDSQNISYISNELKSSCQTLINVASKTTETLMQVLLTFDIWSHHASNMVSISRLIETLEVGSKALKSLYKNPDLIKALDLDLLKVIHVYEIFKSTRIYVKHFESYLQGVFATKLQSATAILQVLELQFFQRGGSFADKFRKKFF